MAATSSIIAHAVEFLKSGQLVAFPTETVYGLGADASSAAAIDRLYRAKGRPCSHPVIIHVADVRLIKQWAEDVPDIVFDLAEVFWPGPLTFILKRQPHVLDAVTGGQDSVGLRMPNHPVALELLSAFGGGVAAPSANKFGALSPTCAQDVTSAFGDLVAAVLDGGRCQVGIESTIVDVRGASVSILRPGMVTAEQLEKVIGRAVLRVSADNPSTLGDINQPQTRVPGALQSHYAPSTPLSLVGNGELVENVLSSIQVGKKVLVLAGRPAPTELSDAVRREELIWKVAPSDAEEYARQLYASLHEFDQLAGSRIFVGEPPQGGEWDGIWDRLRRASSLPEKNKEVIG